MKYFFIDTNVVIDLLTDRQPFTITAAQLFNFAEKGKVKLFISALSYSHIYYVLKKNTTHKELISLLKELELITETIDVTRQIIVKSISSDFKDFEDAIQYNTAISNKRITAIVTRNTKDYKNSELPVLSPEEAIGLL